MFNRIGHVRMGIGDALMGIGHVRMGIVPRWALGMSRCALGVQMGIGHAKMGIGDAMMGIVHDGHWACPDGHCAKMGIGDAKMGMPGWTLSMPG